MLHKSPTLPFILGFITGHFDHWHLGYFTLFFSDKTVAIQDRLEVGFNHPANVKALLFSVRAPTERVNAVGPQ